MIREGRGVKAILTICRSEVRDQNDRATNREKDD